MLVLEAFRRQSRSAQAATCGTCTQPCLRITRRHTATTFVLAMPMRSIFLHENIVLTISSIPIRKPILCWGHGIVMGGGVRRGLMAGASHRVVTERSKIAMPGDQRRAVSRRGRHVASRTHVPGHSGLFLALTGAPLAAADALFVGMADYHVEHAEKASVYGERLGSAAWADDRRSNEILLADILRSASPTAREASFGPLRGNLDRINDVCSSPRMADVIAGIIALASDEPWLANGARAACGRIADVGGAGLLTAEAHPLSFTRGRVSYRTCGIAALRGEARLRGRHTRASDRQGPPTTLAACGARRHNADADQQLLCFAVAQGRRPARRSRCADASLNRR